MRSEQFLHFNNSRIYFTGNIHFETDAPEACMGLFYDYRERKSRESSRISVNLCPIRAAFDIFLTDS